jgi:hypothetical protein
MTQLIAIAIGAVFVCWLVAAYTIWKWGPGLRARRVRCPEKKLRAKVLADQREAEFAGLRVVDVTACSLLPERPLGCSKQCVARL